MISVVLPVHNGARYISQAIDSIVQQSYKDWELIIVDDCSTDNTFEIISKYAERDFRVKIIRNKTNKKIAASLNIGFQIATGDLFTWTSDDNAFDKNAFEIMNDFLSKKMLILYLLIIMLSILMILFCIQWKQVRLKNFHIEILWVHVFCISVKYMNS